MTDTIQKPAQLKRFSNKVQLLRHISETEGVDIDQLWKQYEQQINTTTGTGTSTDAATNTEHRGDREQQ